MYFCSISTILLPESRYRVKEDKAEKNKRKKNKQLSFALLTILTPEKGYFSSLPERND